MGNVTEGQLLANAVADKHQPVDWHPRTVVVHLLLLQVYLQLLVRGLGWDIPPAQTGPRWVPLPAQEGS